MRAGARLALVAFVVALAGVSAGCGTRHRPRVADKAGGFTGPVVLRLGASDGAGLAESRLVRYFAAEVSALSHGKLRVHVTFLAAGSDAPDVETRTIELVRAGRFDLGWVAARAWDELGVKSLQALQAPFLITNYALLDKVVKSALARRMLAGLKTEGGVVPLALIPGLLRHPVGFERPLGSLSDFAGARVRDLPSQATDALLRALGATPLHLGNTALESAVEGRRVDGEELSLANAPVGGIVTANVTFFPKTLTLFAGKRVFDGLSTEQQRVLRTAAQRTLESNATYPVRAALAFEGTLARQYCRRPGAPAALATAQELAALVRATRPVYAELERDPQTKAAIAEIRVLNASLPPAPPLVVPSSCITRGQGRGGTAAALSPSILNGTYHRLLTAAGARAFGPPADDPGNTYPLVITAVLRDGKWMANGDQPPDAGRYTVAGSQLVFKLGRNVMRFTFSRNRDGTLHLKPILPMDRGDQWIMAGAPWRWVGPPIKRLP